MFTVDSFTEFVVRSYLAFHVLDADPAPFNPLVPMG
jgi:hypothetical protein